jgi:O-antigen/teichoic acid export membrane protein
LNKKQKSIDSSSEEFIVIAKGAGIVLVGTAIGTGMRLLFRAFIGRYLGPSLLGLFLIGLGLFRILERVACLGLQHGVVRYVSLYLGEGDKKRLKGIIILGLGISSACGICVGIVLFFGSSFIANNIYNDSELVNVLRAFAIAIPFSAISIILLFSTQGFQVMQYKVYVKELIEPVSRILIFSFLYFLGWELFGALIAFVLSVVIGTFMAFLYLKKVFPSFFSKKMSRIFETKELLHFSWPLFFVGFFYLSILWMNTLLIGYFLFPDDVGVFGAAHSLAMLGLLVVNAFVSIFAPVISDLSNRKQYEKLKSLFKGITKWILTLSLPIFILMIYYAEDIIRLTYGEKFIQGASVLVILSIALLINSFIGSSGLLTAMSGKPKIELVNLGIVLFINAILSVMLIPRYGIQGAAYATLGAFILLNLLRIIEVGMLFHMHPFRRDLFKPFLAGGLSFLFLFLLVNHLPLSLTPTATFFGGSLVFMCIYGLIILSLGLGEEDKMVIEKIKGKIKTS